MHFEKLMFSKTSNVFHAGRGSWSFKTANCLCVRGLQSGRCSGLIEFELCCRIGIFMHLHRAALVSFMTILRFLGPVVEPESEIKIYLSISA